MLLVSMGYNDSVAVISLLQIPIHLLSVWFFVSVLGLEIEGAAHAVNLTQVLQLVG